MMKVSVNKRGHSKDINLVIEYIILYDADMYL